LRSTKKLHPDIDGEEIPNWMAIFGSLKQPEVVIKVPEENS
jgi:hypothetical protein